MPSRTPLWMAALLALGAAAPAGGAPGAAGGGAAEIEPLIDATVEALHVGDYPLARRRLEEARRRGASDAGVVWLEAYTRAWEGATDIGALSEDASFMELLDRVRGMAEADRKAGTDGRTAYYAGLASMMRARTQFSETRREVFKAAADTRRGMRWLERAIRAGHEVPDASFWVGAYHAMASALPAPLRALKALLGLPGAQRERGVEALELASREGRRFRTEARLFTAGALAPEREDGYALGVDLLRPILPELAAGGSLMPLFAGELLADWGLVPQALALWQGVLERHTLHPAFYSPAEIARVRLGIAGVLYQERRWAEAVPHLRAAADSGAEVSAGVRERALLLLARCHARLGEDREILALLARQPVSERTRRRLAGVLQSGYPDADLERQLSSSLEIWRRRDAQAARAELEEFVRHHPGHASGLLHAGRAAFDAGDLNGARRHFRKLVELEAEHRPPKDALGWAHLYLGWAADLESRREEALEHYRRAERQEGFEARRAGALFAQVAYPLLPCRDPDVWALTRGERAGGVTPAPAAP